MKHFPDTLVTLVPLPASTVPSEPLPAAVPQPAAPTRSATPVASGQGPKQAVTRSGRPIAVEPAAPDGSVEGLTAALPVAPAPQAPASGPGDAARAAPSMDDVAWALQRERAWQRRVAKPSADVNFEFIHVLPLPKAA